MKKSLLAVAAPLALASALVLGACSSGDHDSMGAADGAMDMGNAAMGSDTTGAPIPADAAFNATDVAFAQGMIPHHAQAIEMSDMALTQATDPRITALATAIKAAQAPEIQQLTGWLQEWEQPVPSTTGGAGHSMSDMGGMMMSGMMSDADMGRLAGSTGASFDRMWVEMMIQHHRGAVTMAQEELQGGKYQPAKDMAAAIVTTQQAEIAQMEALLGQLPS